MDAGPHPPPGETGARFIIRQDGRRINLAFMPSDAERTLSVSSGGGQRWGTETSVGSCVCSAHLECEPWHWGPTLLQNTPSFM